MSSTIVIALIGAAGLIVGSVVTAFVSAYAAKQKIREIELTYLQKIKEDYLANARLYTNGVYVPISIALSKLLKQYYDFRTYIDFTNETVEAEQESKFRDASKKYLVEVSALSDRGADAFLTAELEEKLRSFNSFLTASLTSQEPRVRFILSYSMGMPWTAQLGYSVATEVQGKWAKFVRRIPKVNIRFAGIGFSYLKEEILAAPLTSREFEQRIIGDERVIKILIKEVTLGAHITSSIHR